MSARSENKPQRRFAPCRLILIHRFPLSLLFHNYRSLSVPIHGYNLQTLLLYLGFFTLLSTLRVAFPFLPLFLSSLAPLYSTPVSLSLPPFFLPSLSLSFLEDAEDDVFLDCSPHEYRRLQSSVAYSIRLSGILRDASLPPHGAVNWSECNSSTLV